MSKGLSRFIPQEEIDDKNVVQWRFGAVDAPGAAFTPAQPSQFVPAGLQFNGFAPTLAHPSQLRPEVLEAEPQESAESAFDQEQLQQMLEQARAEGHAQGLAEGQAQAQQQWQQRLDDYVAGVGRDNAQRVSDVVQSLEDSFRQMQAAAAQDLLKLACDIARQVVRQELRSQPQALLPVVHEALDMLVEESRPVTVRLNPADHAALDEALRAEHGAHSRIQWVGDAAIAGGGVKVECGDTEIDGGLDKRWRRAVAALGLVSTWYEGGQP
ncbi:FliH/SctL family protein [Comamonas guangdongensis]|uniref:Flagellar assembly protein FliH n=1 Tax=Comamonas guangdongensis TaxID=510515 RepID=A0ABV3ZR71_9BURK